MIRQELLARLVRLQLFIKSYGLADLKNDIPDAQINFLSKKNQQEFYIIYDWVRCNLSKINSQYDEYLQELSIDTSEYIPKVYVFWDKGFEDAPDIVKYCKSFLQSNHNESEIQFLDIKSLVKMNMLDLTYFDRVRSWAPRTDLMRLELLSKYGGVWIDADMLALVNLHSYYKEMINKRKVFFALSDSESFNIRLGFLSAVKHNIITSKMYVALRLLWDNESRFFLEKSCFHHQRWLFSSLCLLDRDFSDEWLSKSLTRDSLPIYNFVRSLARNNGDMSNSSRYLALSNIHVLTHKYPNVNVDALDQALIAIKG